jgi:hypothetical protein
MFKSTETAGLDAETTLPHTSTNKDHGYTPTLSDGFAQVDTPRQTDPTAKPIVEDHTLHTPFVPQNRIKSNRQGPLHISHLLSPTSPELPPAASAANSRSTHEEHHPSQAPPFNPSNLASPECASYATDMPCRPPPVTFTDDGWVKSHLPPNVLKSLRREFDKVARISVTSPKAPQESSPLRFFPLRVIMRCDLGTFFQMVLANFLEP